MYVGLFFFVSCGGVFGVSVGSDILCIHIMIGRDLCCVGVNGMEWMKLKEINENWRKILKKNEVM